MTNLKSTKRALFSSVIALLICFSMLLGTTFAWFTDSVTSANNVIQTGTLDVQLLMNTGDGYEDISNSTSPIFGAGSIAQDNNLETLWEPGKTQVAYLAIKNAGTLDLQYKVNLSVTSYTKNLYEVMEYVIVPDATPDAPVLEENLDWDAGIAVVPGVNTTEATQTPLAADEVHYFALVIHMDDNADNEYQDGEITFDISVLATQLASESDSFGTDYDAAAGFPTYGVGIVTVTDQPVYGFEIYDKETTDHNVQKVGYASVPADAIAEGAETVSVTIAKQESADANVTIASNEQAVTYEVSVTNLKEDNNAEVRISIRVGEGLTGVRLYHTDSVTKETRELTAADDFTYDGEYIHFASTSFSPFTVVYGGENDEYANSVLPIAKVEIVTDTLNVDLDCNGDGEPDGWSDMGKSGALSLDAVYKFTAPADIDAAGLYQDWYCDYYVKFVPASGSTITTLPAGTIGLGGNYGDYGWIGFDNPEVAVNEFIPLLATFSGNSEGVNSYWTYANVYAFVEEFLCGVAEVDDADGVLDGAQFVVELRLTNPENLDDYYPVNTVVYDFSTGESTITSYPG